MVLVSIKWELTPLFYHYAHALTHRGHISFIILSELLFEEFAQVAAEVRQCIGAVTRGIPQRHIDRGPYVLVGALDHIGDVVASVRAELAIVGVLEVVASLGRVLIQAAVAEGRGQAARARHLGPSDMSKPERGYPWL